MLERFSPDAASNSNKAQLQITIIIIHQDYLMKRSHIIYQTVKSNKYLKERSQQGNFSSSPQEKIGLHPNMYIMSDPTPLKKQPVNNQVCNIEQSLSIEQ